MNVDKSTTLLEALELLPGGPELHKVAKKTMELTGLNEVQLSEILEPYSEKILSESPFSEEDINKIIAEISKKSKE